MATHDVFISYSSLDKGVADAVCHGLEAQGVRCWIAPRDVTPGMDWQMSLLDAIGSAKAVVLIFTGNANDSANVKKEVTAAFEGGAVVIPFRLEAVEPEGSLRYHLTGVHWLDALTPPLEENVRQLAQTLKRVLDRQPPAASADEANPVAAPVAPAKVERRPEPPPRIDRPLGVTTASPTAADRTSEAKPSGLPLWVIGLGVIGVVVVLALAAVAISGNVRHTARPEAPPNQSGQAGKPTDGPAANLDASASVPVSATPPATALTPQREEALLILRTELQNAPMFAGERDATPGSTPLSVPGVTTVATGQLVNALGNQLSEVTVIDAAGCADGHASIPTAVCLEPNTDPVPALRASGLDAERPLVFLCHGPTCAWSQTMALQAVRGGWRNVFWYRGGLAAWGAANGPTAPPQPMAG